MGEYARAIRMYKNRGLTPGDLRKRNGVYTDLLELRIAETSEQRAEILQYIKRTGSRYFGGYLKYAHEDDLPSLLRAIGGWEELLEKYPQEPERQRLIQYAIVQNCIDDMGK
jgi:hypothetical protein